MANDLLRAFLGARVYEAAPASYLEMFPGGEVDRSRDGVLVYNVGPGNLELNDNDADAAPWYVVAAGATKFVPFPGNVALYFRGQGGATPLVKAQQVRI